MPRKYTLTAFFLSETFDHFQLRVSLIFRNDIPFTYTVNYLNDADPSLKERSCYVRERDPTQLFDVKESVLPSRFSDKNNENKRCLQVCAQIWFHFCVVLFDTKRYLR